MKRLLLAATVLAGTASLALPAMAAPIVYQLNTSVNGNTLTNTASYGTVTYTDNGNSVMVTIDLADHSNGASKITMNYNDAKFPLAAVTDYTWHWTVSGDADDIIQSENAQQAGGYTLGKFDITIANGPHGDKTFDGSEPYTFYISLTDEYKNGSKADVSYNLDPADFNFAIGGLYNVVLIDCDPQWVGSRVTTAVPEPATMALLGLGMIGTGMMTRRRRSSATPTAG